MDEPGKSQLGDIGFLRMPWTIEHQLEAYSKNPRHTDRHETLFWSWKQLSRWLANLLNYVIGSFPTYSKHDETHCRAVLHNIECLLGEDEIRRLSPTDCFGILVAVYLHDIGMCVSEDDKAEIISSDDFYYSIEDLEDSPDPELRAAALILKETDYQIETKGNPDEIRKNFKELYRKKLDIYKSVALLLGEHSRGVHARKARDRVYEWVKDSDQTQSGFAMTSIPLRIFLQLAECARLHNEAATFKDVANTLLECDNGFAYDKYHPRFIAVLLMLGDILDVDNNRFNPFVKMMAGKSFTDRSEVHYQKHLAIRALRISPKIIRIQADCAHTDELRQLRAEFDWLEKFLQDCNYHWAEIAPEDFCGCLPALSFDKIRLEGQEIPSDLVSSRFLISQRKAFRLLQGANLYSNRFVFLRELLQNATDATKRQYWTELEAVETTAPTTHQLVDANRILPLKRYPIHVDFQIKKRKKWSSEDPVDITDDDFNQASDFHQKYELGVLVSIQDSGIGISQEDIRAIIEVGTSHERDRDILSQMPEWLRPNGRFGIGLQSVFLVGDTFQCITRTRQKECYKITFHSGATGDGHIDVIPYNSKDHSRESIPYGTSFSIFVPESYREDRSKNDIGWIGADPYDTSYQMQSGIRDAAELMRQMEHYLDSQIGEWIFPVILREFPLHPSLKGIKEKVFPRQELWLRHAIRQPICEQDITEFHWVPLREKDNEWSNWLFREIKEVNCLQESFALRNSGDAGVYRIEVERGRIKVWSQKHQCFFCCSPARILGFRNESRDGPRKNEKIRVYIKGLFVSEIEYPGNELLEYLDVESDKLQSGLQMDRDSLNERGKACLTQEIIPELLRTFYGILQFINIKIDETVQNHQRKIIHALEDEYSRIIESYVDDIAEYRRILSSFKIKLSKLSRENYVLFELMRDRNAEQSCEEKAVNFRVMEQDDSRDLFSNDLITIIDNEDYVTFIKKKANGKNTDRQKMIRALHSAAQTIWETEKDYVTIFLMDFLARLDKILTLIINSGKSGQASTEQNLHPTTREWRQAWVRLLSGELQGYVLLYGMFFYYVNQGDAFACSECVQNNDRPCYWQFINDKIADILRYAIDKLQNNWGANNASYGGLLEIRKSTEIKVSAELAENTELFKKTLYVCGVEEQTPAEIEYYSVAEILKNENHFAVFSTRQTRQDIWKHLLIRLSPFENRFPDYKLASPNLTVFDILNTSPGSPLECVERWSFLDQWNADIIENIQKNHIHSRSRAGESNGDKMLNLDVWGSEHIWWMIHHHPTLSLGSDREGNNRINVLGRRANAHVFVDARTVLLLLERAKDHAPEMAVPRFQTTVWDGFAALRVKEISKDVKLITRGVLSDENKINIMLLGIPYLLPEKARFPYDKTDPEAKQVSLEELDVCTLPQLLDYIKAAYSNKEKSWDTLEQQAIISQCETIVGFSPFCFGEEGFVWDYIELIKGLYKEQFPEESWDRPLVSDDHAELTEALRGIFEACISNALESIRWQEVAGGLKEKPFSPCTTWKRLDLPVDRKLYILLFLLKAYNVELDTDKYAQAKEMAKYLPESQLTEAGREDEFAETTKRLCYALVYCAYYAEEEYRATFLKDICAWWQEEIWANDPGKENFLRYSAEQTELLTDELELLYMAQVRRIICSVLSDTGSYLETLTGLGKVRGVVYGLPPELLKWIQKSIRKSQEGNVL